MGDQLQQEEAGSIPQDARWKRETDESTFPYFSYSVLYQEGAETESVWKDYTLLQMQVCSLR